MIYYFAYGSNMNHAHMRQLCPKSSFLKRAYLEDYAVAFDRAPDASVGAVATIVPSRGKQVWGGLFLVADGEISALDAYEDYPRFYEKMVVKVKDEEGFIYDALCYYRSKRVKGMPLKEYLTVVIQGARDCKLPEEYIRQTFVP